jgi:hypothetical protein
MTRVSAFLAGVGGAVRGVLDALWRALSSDPEFRPWERAAVRIVVPVAFVSAALVATFMAYRTDRPPGVAFENHLIFGGGLLLLGFYGMLLVLVPLVRALAGGALRATQGMLDFEGELADLRKRLDEFRRAAE